MKFEIDVSGSDIFDEDFTICIANKNEEKHIIKGFRFNTELITNKLVKNWNENKYKYDPSKKGVFKARLYSIVVYYLFKSIPQQKFLSLTICRDFCGHENDINQTLKHLLENVLKTTIGKPRHQKLPNSSNAHWYAYLIRKDNANQLPNHVDISIEEIEKYLKKKVTPKGLTTEIPVRPPKSALDKLPGN
ncbi:MAG: hypothetical protein KKF46_04050 [Nanoarchaeota archaeon]|nr:hypothetical protein [Nanoarchaeota archaeon]MBU1321507.1 hypothetical protein [Nanoarchaeota archaeon]MBU1597124.1 hypothetical protein [Nanoarchaeota archaeon]MBU2441542.1 hypothetical protein [Nanoarchaeota archaeon]